MIKKALLLTLIIPFLLVPVFAQSDSDNAIPSWIKVIAGSWAKGEINDITYINAMESLIKNNIIQIENPVESTSEESISTEYNLNCGPGTVFDPNANSCVLGSTVDSKNSTSEIGVSTEANSKCGLGTTFDPNANSCILDIYTVEENTIDMSTVPEVDPFNLPEDNDTSQKEKYDESIAYLDSTYKKEKQEWIDKYDSMLEKLQAENDATKKQLYGYYKIEFDKKDEEILKWKAQYMELLGYNTD